MANQLENALKYLNQDFEFDPTTAFEFGWCNVVDAKDRQTQHDMRLYVPRGDVWEQSAHRKTLRNQFQGYFKTDVQESLPEAVDLIEKARSGLDYPILVTRRDTAPNIFDGEKQGRGAVWSDVTDFPFPDKLGAIHAFARALKSLHELGIVHGSIGAKSVKCIKRGATPVLILDLLNFGTFDDTGIGGAPIFAPAFIAPELLGENAKRTEQSDAFSFGRVALLFVTGTRGFIELFTGDEDLKTAEPDQVLSMLHDPALWRNSTSDTVGPDPDAVVAASGNTMSIELAEFFSYVVAPEPASRPQDGAIVYHGLTTSMGGGASATVAKIDSANAAAGSLMDYLKPAAAVLFLGVVGVVGWTMISNKKAHEANVEAAFGACTVFSQTMQDGAQGPLVQTAAWSRASELRQLVSQDRARENPTETRETCEEGQRLADLAASEVGVLDRLATLEASATAAQNEGVDLAAFDINGVKSETQALLQNLNVEGAQSRVDAATASLDEARASHHTAGLTLLLEEARGLNQTLGLTDDAVATEALEALLPQLENGVDTTLLGNLQTERSALETAVSEKMGAYWTASIAALTGTVSALTDQDAASAHPRFSALAEAVTGLTDAAAPQDLDALGAFQTSKTKLEAELDDVATTLANFGDLLPQLTARIEEQLAFINTKGWAAENGFPDSISSYQSRPDESDFKAHSRLERLSAILVGQIAEQQSVEEELFATCDLFLSEAAENDAWAASSKASEIEAALAEAAPDNRNFARAKTACPEGRSMLVAASFSAEGRLIVAGVAEDIVAAKEEGLGPYLSSFTSAMDEFDNLSQEPLPVDQEGYEAFSSRAAGIKLALSAARSELSAETDSNASLRSEFEQVQETALSKSLENLTEYKAVAAEFPQLDTLDVVSENQALTASIAAVKDVMTRFDAGEFLNCAISDETTLQMAAMSAEGAQSAQKALKTAGLEVETAPISGNYCLAGAQTTVADFEAFGASLTPQQADIAVEIARIEPADDGTATNVSHWLASRYVEWISQSSGTAVCIAPLSAVAMASASNPDLFAPVGSGELVAESCSTSEVLRRNVVLRQDESGELTASCVSSSATVEGMGFRLATGDICNAQ